MLLSLLSSAQCGSFVQQTVGRKGRDAPFFLHRHSTRPIARKDNQAGFVLKNGVFQKIITAGIWYFPKMLGYQVEV